MRTTDDNLGWDFDDDPPPRQLRPSGAMRSDPLGRQTADFRRLASPFLKARTSMTPKKRIQLVRDLEICFASQVLGLSQREIAELTGLPHSRIHAILSKMSALAAGLDVEAEDEADADAEARTGAEIVHE